METIEEHLKARVQEEIIDEHFPPEEVWEPEYKDEDFRVSSTSYDG